jgi:hypothetical protein
MSRILLDPANLHEVSRTPAFTRWVTGADGGYWTAGTGSRWVWTTSATKARVRISLVLGQIHYRVNGFDHWVHVETDGSDWVELALPLGANKRFELFMPAEGKAFGGPLQGIYPIEIEFNATATVVAPVVGGTHRIVYGDSISGGTGANAGLLQGYVGIMKRGTSDASLPTWKGAYSAGTLYAPRASTARLGDVVSYNGGSWEKKSNAAAGTTPAVGSDWELRGFIGKVSEVAYGSRRLQDDCSNGTAQTAFATYIASLAPSELTMLIGTNDWVIGGGGWSAASFQSAYTGFLNALAATSASAITVRCISPLITSSREVANAAGNTMDDYRSAVSAAVSATTKSSVTFVDGKSILAVNDLVDGLHPTTAGHLKLRQALGV